MTDDPNAFGAGALMPDTPLPAEQMPLPTPDMPAISRVRSDAMAQINALKGDAAFQERLLRGDLAALADVQRLQKIINSPTSTVVGGVDPSQTQQQLDAWQNFASFDPGVLEQIRSRGAVTADEFKFAKAEKTRLMADKGWCAKYLDGDRAARQQMSLISVILSSPIASEQK